MLRVTLRAPLSAVVAILFLAACGHDSATTAPGPSTTSQEGTFPSTGASLHYALDLPPGSGRFPAVVMGHGSGQSTKSEAAAFVSLWRPLGFAVLRYDKRGVGRSTGVYRPVSAANSPEQIAELAGDMLAGVAFLKTRPDIDGSRIGLMGVSQAGWLMASAAGQSPDVRFFVAAVGSVMPIGENIFYENLRTVPLEQAYEQLAAYSGPEGWDPIPSLRAATAPGIWLLADEDRLVPTRICREKLAALRSEGHRYTVRVYPGFGHELGGSATFWPDVASWLESERLR